MRACVIGTSNTIQRGGWFDGFKEAFPGDVRRIALGGSPFIQFLGLLRDIERSHYDVILFDTAPNDDSFYAAVANEFIFDSCFYKFVSSLMSIAPSAMVYIPTERAYQRGSVVFERQREICEVLGCKVLDLTPLISAHAAELGLPSHRDLQHPSTPIMNAIGKWIATQTPFPQRFRIPRDYSDLFENIEVVSGDHQKTVIDSTLIKEEFSVLDAGKTVRLRQSIFSLGFFVDAGHTNGVVRLHGAKGRRDIFCYFDLARNARTKRFVPIPDGFEISAVSVVRHSEAAEFALHSSSGFSAPYRAAFGKFLTYRLTLAPS